MKKKYQKASMEIVAIDPVAIICTSQETPSESPQTEVPKTSFGMDANPYYEAL